MQNVEITSISTTDSYLNTVYEVETKDVNNHVQIVTISVEPEQKPVIVQVTEKVTEETSVSVTQETKVTKTVSETTGETVTITTGETGATEEVKTCAPEIVKELPEIANCQSVNSQNTESGESSWKTISYQCSNGKRIQVTVLEKKNKKCTVVDSK